jgi:hypothetical protein
LWKEKRLMGAPQRRTVRLVGGPADGREVRTGHAWVLVSIQDGDLVQFDIDVIPDFGRDSSEAEGVLNRVARREDWVEYLQDDPDAHPDVYTCADIAELAPVQQKWFSSLH